MENIKNQMQDYAKDIKLNLSSVMTEEGSTGLTQKQIDMIALGCAYAIKNTEVTKELKDSMDATLTDDELYGVKAAVSLMSMNNIYYRFVHLSENDAIAKMPAKLRMNVMRDPKIDKKDFELISLAVSAINGCGMCISSHIHSLQKLDVTNDAIQSTAKIASVIHALDQSLALASQS